MVAGARRVFRPVCGPEEVGRSVHTWTWSPSAEGRPRRLEVREALAPPELLLIDPMAPLDFAVLLRPPSANVPAPEPGGLDPQHKGEGELLPVIALQSLDGEREGHSELGNVINPSILVFYGP